MGNTQTPLMTYCEIKKRNSEGANLLFCNNYVYDVKDYLNTHPGGAKILLSKCQKLKSIEKDINFHSCMAQELMKKYIIAKVTKCSNKTCKIC